MDDHPQAVVITGLGGWTALGAGWKRTWASLLRGESAIAPCGPDLPAAAGLSAGLIRDLGPFRAAFPKLRPAPLKHSRLVLFAAREALADAGMRTEGWSAEIGAMFDRGWDADAIAMRLFAAVIDGGAKATSPMLFSQGVANAPLGGLAQYLGIRGPHLLTISGGALYIAVCALRAGEVSAIVAGGFDELEPHRLVALDQAGLINAHAEPSRYRDQRGPRTFGEGCVALVLERADAARARGARCYARVTAISHRTGSGPLRGWCAERPEDLNELVDSVLARAEVDRCRVGLTVGANGAHRLGGHIGDSLGMGASASIALAAYALLHREIPAATGGGEAGVLRVDSDVALVTDVGFEGQLFACLLEQDAA